MQRILKSNRTFEHNVAITQGKNWFTKSRLRKFTPLAWWHLLRAPHTPSEYVNKSVGVSASLNPHKNSIRVGWRRESSTMEMHWYIYSYVNGKRMVQELPIFQGCEELIISFKNIPITTGNMVSSELVMELKVPENPTLVQTIIIPFMPKWFTNFYWGGDAFPRKSDYFWYRSNLQSDTLLVSLVNTAFSYSPTITAVGGLLAMFLLGILLISWNATFALVVCILVLVSFLGFVLRNFINYERWLYKLERFWSRIKSKRQEI